MEFKNLAIGLLVTLIFMIAFFFLIFGGAVNLQGGAAVTQNLKNNNFSALEDFPRYGGNRNGGSSSYRRTYSSSSPRFNSRSNYWNNNPYDEFGKRRFDGRRQENGFYDGLPSGSNNGANPAFNNGHNYSYRSSNSSNGRLFLLPAKDSQKPEKAVATTDEHEADKKKGTTDNKEATKKNGTDLQGKVEVLDEVLDKEKKVEEKKEKTEEKKEGKTLAKDDVKELENLNKESHGIKSVIVSSDKKGNPTAAIPVKVVTTGHETKYLADLRNGVSNVVNGIKNFCKHIWPGRDTSVYHPAPNSKEVKANAKDENKIKKEKPEDAGESKDDKADKKDKDAESKSKGAADSKTKGAVDSKAKGADANAKSAGLKGKAADANAKGKLLLLESSKSDDKKGSKGKKSNKHGKKKGKKSKSSSLF